MRLVPILQSGSYKFVKPVGDIPKDALAMFRESAGVVAIVPNPDSASWFGVFAWITCPNGSTPKVSKVLSENGISCNIWSTENYDHAIVPFPHKDRAVQLLSQIEL